MLPHSISERSLLVVAPDGEELTMHRDNEHWDATIEALRNSDDELVLQLITPRILIQRFIARNGAFDISEGDVKYNGESLGSTYVTAKILRFTKEGLPVEPLLKFFDNLSQNPSFRVRKDLLEFLDKGNLPITDGGCFLSYKYTRKDGFDEYSGKVQYEVGTIVEMPRSQVDDDPSNTCSAGLHVASRHYFGSYGSETHRFIICRVNPKDVVSIPSDYNHSKMRVCRLVVDAEIARPEEDNIWGGSQIVGTRVTEVILDDIADIDHCLQCGNEVEDHHLFCDDCDSDGTGD